MTPVTMIFDPRYCTDAAGTNSTRKQQEVVDAALAEGWVACHPTPVCDIEATWRDVQRVHGAAYTRAVQTGTPRGLAESQGFTWSPDFANAVARIWHGQYAAGRLALARGGFVFHPVSGAHHAGRDHGSGFCTLNFLAGAGLRLVRDGVATSVGIVDLDAHQGNGTFDWVREAQTLPTFDIAGSSWGVDVTPTWAEYHVVGDSRAYQTVLDTHFNAWLDRTRPTVVLYQAAVDCWERDNVGGIAGVDARFLAWRDRFVLTALHRRRIPTVINIGGGYMPSSKWLHVQTAGIAADVQQKS